MSRCTAPRQRYRSASARENCPACGSRFSSYRSYSITPYSPAGGGVSNSSGHSRSKPRWSTAGSSVLYTPNEIRSLTPIRETVETRAAQQPDLRDVFLCHAWDDRQGAAKELYDLLEAAGVKVWFSEKDLGLGVPMMRAIDKGLRTCAGNAGVAQQASQRRRCGQGAISTFSG